MKILHLSTYDALGGAAKAAYRIHHSQQIVGIDSTLMVIAKQLADPSVILPNSLNHLAKLKLYKDIKEDQTLSIKHGHIKGILISTGRVGSNLAKEINDSHYDLVNLHWINNMLSIADIGSIRKPIVWTFHDMWPFSGIFHYAVSAENVLSNGSNASLAELDRVIFSEKVNYWKNQTFTVITPSFWLSKCAKESALFSNSAIHTIAHPISLIDFYRRNVISSRNELGLPLDQHLILFCAMNPLNNPIKGWKTVYDTMRDLEAAEPGKYSLVICGSDEDEISLPFRSYWLGKIHDDERLAKLYSAVDILICPSKQEAFGQVALEAQACGTPVIASNIGGLKDIIKNNETGLLVNEGNSNAFLAGISKILNLHEDIKKISAASIKNAFSLSDQKVIGNQYYDIYNKILSAK